MRDPVITDTMSGVARCVYCGDEANGESVACPAHSDLVALDPVEHRWGRWRS